MFAGGLNNNGETINNIYCVYINANDEYNTITGTLSTSRSNLSAASITNNEVEYAVFAGGVDENGASDIVDIIYISNGTV